MRIIKGAVSSAKRATSQYTILVLFAGLGWSEILDEALYTVHIKLLSKKFNLLIVLLNHNGVWLHEKKNQ